MDTLLNEKDHYKILLLKLFNLQVSSKLSISYCVEKFGLSKYKFNQLMDDLMLEVQKDKKDFTLIDVISDGDMIIWSNISNEYIQYKRREYIQQSEKFELFQFIFVEGGKISEFIDKKFVSRKKAYRINSELNETLKPYNVSIESSKIRGSESDIRNVAYQIYYNFFSEELVPFNEEIDRYVDTLLYAVKQTDVLNLKYITPTQLKKIRFFLSVVHIRITYGYYIKEDVELTQIGEEKLNNFFSRIHSITNTDYLKSEPYIKSEMFYLYQFIRLNISGVEFEDIKAVKNLKIERSVYRFIESLKKFNFYDSVAEESIKILYQKLSLINERLLEFPWIPITFNDKQSQTYFEENYNLFHQVVINFIENDEFYKELNLSISELNGTYYDYMFSLIEYLPIDIIYRNVNIFIDFSRGEMYTDYITKNIQSYRDLNIKIQNQINQKTDIIVSDFKTTEAKYRQIIWKNPPSPSDWRLFADAVLEVKKEKS